MLINRYFKILILGTTVIGIIFFLYLSTILPLQKSLQPDFLATNVTTPNSHYLTRYPTASSNNSEVPTKIFLASATPFYGYSNASFVTIKGDQVHRGDLLLKINVAIRNDYSVDEIQKLSPKLGLDVYNESYVSLDVILNDKQGNRLAYIDINNPATITHHSYTTILKSGEMATFTMNFVVPNQDIENLKIFVGYLGNIPEP